MKRFTVILFSFFNFLIAANAQQAGDIISGTVNDEMGPVMMANVVRSMLLNVSSPLQSLI